VGDTPPHDSDDERDYLAALDFFVAESGPVGSDLDVLGDYPQDWVNDQPTPEQAKTAWARLFSTRYAGGHD
jgi:hypothetical protein